jgi:hypothetical protein
MMLLATLFVVTAGAQDPVAVAEAELSVPFGVAEGRVVAVADQLLFVDEEEPRQSFALRRSNIIQSSSDNGVLRIRTDAPVNDATAFSFRVRSGDAAGIIAWLDAPSAFSDTAVRPSADASAAVSVGGGADADSFIGEYRVAHSHFLGECEGTLRITDDGIDFQSITEANHSRRWQMSDVKELERPDRDELRIAPMIGSQYNFDFVSERLISDEEFRRLSDRVSEARLGDQR